ncbi:MAG: rhomboid family intramembrane serine protease [Pedobacter sp.]|nr:MAG: rhomboid family intramembrane serine protease [Pedobacter sp.]
MNNISPVVKNLLIINVIFFIAKFLLTDVNLDLLLAVYYFDSPLFRIWQPISYMFMHGDMMHLFFNMFALYTFGTVLEQRWGSKRFIYFYLITGLGALGLQYMVQAFEVYQITGSVFNPGAVSVDWVRGMVSLNVDGLMDQSSIDTLLGIYGGRMVGASGAIFGLLVAFGMLYPNVELMFMFIPVPIKAKYFVVGYVVIELMLGFGKIQGDSVAHFAHLGGALLGYILIKIWKDKDTFYTYYE